jgi:hypothetical protein
VNTASSYVSAEFGQQSGTSVVSIPAAQRFAKKRCKHCAHAASGYGWSNSFETRSPVVCCKCGGEGSQVTRTVYRKAKGRHGPYAPAVAESASTIEWLYAPKGEA